jgi:hypothetical protein
MRTKLRSKVTLLLIVCAALLAVPGAAALAQDTGTPAAPTIQSDKDDYAPGELVTLTGSGWQAGESVNIVVNDDVGQTWNRNVNVIADPSGNITDQFNLPDWFVATYSVTATGSSGTANTTFTDANVQVTSPSPARFPATGQEQIAAGSSQTFSATVTRTGSGDDPTITGVATQNGNPGCPGTNVQTIPLSWVSVVGAPITVSGSTNVSLKVDVPAGQAAGDYQGRFRFAVSNGGATTNLDFCVRVPADTTAPTITASATKATSPVSNYTFGDWSNKDVSVTLNATDNTGGSGVKEIRYTTNGVDPTATSGTVYSAPFSISSEGTTTLKFRAIDNAGNVEAVQSRTVKIDKTNPTFSCPTADSDWHANNQTFNCTASGGDSGLNPTSDSSFSLSTNVAAGSETNNASTGTKTLTDGAGNTVTAGPITGVKVDRKAPNVQCGSADGAWHANDVSINCTANDGGSGVTPTSDANFSLTTNVAANTEDSNASTNSRNVADAVSNSATAGPISGNKVDKKAPAITLTKPASGDSYIAGEVVNANYGCSDNGSGTASCAGTVLNNTAIDTTFGSHTFKVDATDQVGNTSSLTHNYGVSYSFNGWLQPVDGDDTATGAVNMGKVGKTYPIKWQVREYVNGVLQPISDTAAQNLVSSMTGKAKSVTCGSWATLGSDLLEDYTTGNTALRYDATSDQFIYNYKAPSSPVCQAFVISKADGVNDKQANFQFTK